MKEKSILFNTEMVKAILEGRKTQTRRVVKWQPKNKVKLIPEKQILPLDEKDIKNWKHTMKCPYGKVGGRLWVRETWDDPNGEGLNIFYKEDFPYIYNDVHGDRVEMKTNKFKWKSPMTMPKKYSRIKLEITDIRIERVRDITWRCCIEEGIKFVINEGEEDNFIDEFGRLWDSINKKRGYSWGSNPWVWVVEFKQN